MPMTKRDIADIMLVGMIFWLLFQFLIGVISIVVSLGMPQSMELRNAGPFNAAYVNMGAATAFNAVYVLVVLALSYILVFKRLAILSFLFPDGQEKEFSVPSGMESLASYGFWIRLFGIFLFLSYGIKFFGSLTADVAMDWQFNAGVRLWAMTSGPMLLSTILAGVIVWKADWIAEKLQKIGADKERATDSDAKIQ
jgi:hypothetical protein